MTPLPERNPDITAASPAFAAVASSNRPPTRAKRRPPFSLRFSDAERLRLEEEAGGVPLAAHIKEQLFAADAPPVRRRRVPASIEDRQAVAKLLSMLGASRYANNLNQMAHLANLGLLAMTEEERNELALSIAYIAEMRRPLLQSLGLKPEAGE